MTSKRSRKLPSILFSPPMLCTISIAMKNQIWWEKIGVVRTTVMGSTSGRLLRRFRVWRRLEGRRFIRASSIERLRMVLIKGISRMSQVARPAILTSGLRFPRAISLPTQLARSSPFLPCRHRNSFRSASSMGCLLTRSQCSFRHTVPKIWPWAKSDPSIVKAITNFSKLWSANARK